METRKLNGAVFSRMLGMGAAKLQENRQTVNELNVFPIPDGDTGDNMFMTIESGVDGLEGDTSNLGRTAEAAARGMLLGARGNSGVILSRIFYGIAEGLKDLDTADAYDFDRAVSLGVEHAYSAVPSPVEGTILTVLKDAYEFARSGLNENSTVSSYFDSFTDELQRSLKRTPELLDVLKEAGVVDSGGAGLVYIAEGMKNALDGEDYTFIHSDMPKAKSMDFSKFDENSVLEYGYCTEFLLRLQNAKTDIESLDIRKMVSWLEMRGNSVVAFKDGSIVKVHVHTMDPGEVLSYMRRYGEFLTVKIENMSLQHNGTTGKASEISTGLKPHKKYGIVCVAAGDGIKDTFMSLGCDAVIDGGQSMNPSAKAFVDAFSGINADTLFVFPDNGNVILTANHAKDMCRDRDIRVIPTKTLGEGYAAVSVFDASVEDPDELEQGLKEAASGVVTAMVSKASRDADMGGVRVVKDDYIGFVGDKVYSDSPSREEAAVSLCENAGAGNYDILLLIYGADVSEDEAEKLCGELAETYRRTEVIAVNGGQPVYDYILVFE